MDTRNMVYIWGRNRHRPPIYHLEGDMGKTRCGLDTEPRPFERRETMGWAELPVAQRIAKPCGNCHR
jgi:hypothetical protein